MAAIIISGSVHQEKENFEFQDLAGSETFDATLDANHIGIVLDDGVEVASEQIDVCIQKLADALRERAYT